MEKPGLRQLLVQENPLQIVGTINAYSALLAKQAGYRAIYLSGAGVANASHGFPDLGFTNLNDVAEDARRITYACDLPLLVDIDTGWGNVFSITRTIKTLSRAGVSAVHIEDQTAAKRCGHRPRKELVDTNDMCDRIKAAMDAKDTENFVVMARTDALAVEGFDKAQERIHRYIQAGAEMIFFEGATELAQFEKITASCNVPILANITEFGVTPLFTRDELKKAGIKLILYPLSAFRAMSKSAIDVYETIRKEGTQKTLIDEMQTRDQLYQTLDYHRYEQTLDELNQKEKAK